MPKGTCSERRCLNRVYARTWCAKHYRKRWADKATWTTVLIKGDDERRFWSKVEKSKGCWLWTGTISVYGYRRFSFTVDGKRRETSAHRWSYEHLVGPIPDGLHIDHLCRVRNCVRPTHLEAVTCRTNVLRGVAPPAQNYLATHCKHGHPFDDKNTYIRPNGNRGCVTCRRLASERHQRKIGVKPMTRLTFASCPVCGERFKVRLISNGVGPQRTCSRTCGQRLRFAKTMHEPLPVR